MKKVIFTPLILAFAVLIGMVIIPNKWIESLIPKNRVSEAATELNTLMFQGKYIQGQMLEEKQYLPIYGSSELSRLDQFHPSNYFAVNNQGFTPFLVGRGGTESLIHFLNFSEHTDQLKGKKLVFILSPQWFQPRGADESHFVPNYSTLQGYDFAFNNKLDPDLKKKAIKRLLHYTPVKNDFMLSALYQAEISKDPWAKRKALCIKPFAYAYRNVLAKKDLYYSLVDGNSRHRVISPRVKDKSWGELENQAAAAAAKKSRNNQFFVIDSQFNKIKHRVPSLKGYKRGASYGKSLEYYDFQLVLDLLKKSGADPLFISIPVNGKWYDYTGFPKDGRYAYYTRIKKQVENEGFQIADFSGHEYDPYFMKDTIHIGWKGWVYTDRAILDFYHNGSEKALIEAKK